MLILVSISVDVLTVTLKEIRWVNGEVTPARLKYYKPRRGKIIYFCQSALTKSSVSE